MYWKCVVKCFINLRMRLCKLLLILLLLFPVSAQAGDVRFLKAIDGDSLVVIENGYTKEIRLIGIDAPEWGQEWGVEAKAHLVAFCFGHTLRIEYDREEKDRYGRTLAYLWLGSRMLNESLVQNGLAVPIYVKPNGRYYKRLRAAQDRAKSKGLGFWGQGGLKMSPGQWRRAHSN